MVINALPGPCTRSLRNQTGFIMRCQKLDLTATDSQPLRGGKLNTSKHLVKNKSPRTQERERVAWRHLNDIKHMFVCFFLLLFGIKIIKLKIMSCRVAGLFPH